MLVMLAAQVFTCARRGEAENYAHTFKSNSLQVTSFRPSVIFGPEDDFLNRFAKLLKLSPLIFPLACADTKFAPVYVKDVVNEFVRALDDEASFGQRYDICGPEIYSLKELVEFTSTTLGRKHLVFKLPNPIAKLQAIFMELIPNKPFSLDNYQSLQVDSICENGIKCTTSLKDIAPEYLK